MRLNRYSAPTHRQINTWKSPPMSIPDSARLQYPVCFSSDPAHAGPVYVDIDAEKMIIAASSRSVHRFVNAFFGNRPLLLSSSSSSSSEDAGMIPIVPERSCFGKVQTSTNRYAHRR
jgi:hypothetical protein